MRVSQLFMPTLREDPSDAEVISHKLLLRAGMIRKTAQGIYTYLPLAQRVLRKIAEIVREEMDRQGGQEVGLPIVQPRELWELSERWWLYGKEMFRLKDRHERDFCLGPTHEEVITDLVASEVRSYRELPLLLYQIQDKFRDEIRPRFGLMRCREFIMKDLYSFDVDEDGLEISYRKMYFAYNRVFQRLGLDYRVVEADTGAIGGNVSHEFIVLAASGESLVVFCDTCEYAANVEKAECLAPGEKEEAEMLSLTKVATPGMKTVQEVARYLKKDPDLIMKTLIYLVDDQPYAVVVRGDREVNEVKLKNHLKANEVVLAREEQVKQLLGVSFGSIGPVRLGLPVVADLEVKFMRNAYCGANEEGYHFMNVNPGRDFEPRLYVDIRQAQAGDRCPRCGGTLAETRGIEVGHIFKLGTKYSEKLGAEFLDEEGRKRPMIMGCYGIGISRTMAAAVEQNYDENGIIWPIPIAPYHVIVVPVNIDDLEQRRQAEKIYEELLQDGIEVLFDDRDERAGVKFKDADLIGIPIRVTVGPRSLKAGKVELKLRWEKESELVDTAEVKPKVREIIAKAQK